MNINEFLSYNKNCIQCNNENTIVLMGNISEDIGDENKINFIYRYIIPVVRKDFLTFVNCHIAIISKNSMFDISTYNTEKYKTFILHKDNSISFDKQFQYKMKLNFSIYCPNGHYGYLSRLIRISNKSPDITKGFPVHNEYITCDNYQIFSNLIEKKSYITNLLHDIQNPLIIPYMEISDLPYNDKEKFLKKIENMFLLG